MSSSDRYATACAWFRVLVDLEETQQREQLETLRSHDSALAELVVELLKADQIAAADGFLSDSPFAGNTHAWDTRTGGATLSSFPTKIAGYEIIEQIGAGGMGVVFRAYHSASDRIVALKAVRLGSELDDELRVRFQREAKAAARLSHPHLVPIFDVGIDNETYFYTMALIQGQNLRAFLDSKSLAPRQSAELIRKIASAVKHAHEHGIIHRDIKPGNIMIDNHHEPMLTDFGLARTIDLDESLTRSEQMLGTIQYMAPEQIHDARNAGAAADIYGLGATLYYCLTGNPPVKSDGTLMDQLRRVRETMPESPARARPEVDRDIGTICFRCIQKEPCDRYESMADLISDLDCYLRGDPIKSNKTIWWHSIGRQLRRNDLISEMPSAAAAGWIAGVTFLFHFLVFAIVLAEASHVWLWLTIALWLTSTNVVNYIYHWSQFWALSPIERHSGLVQLSLQLTFVGLFLIFGPLSTSQPIHVFLGVYPPLTFAMAIALLAHVVYYGRLLIPGLLLFPLGVLMSIIPAIWSPLLMSIAGLMIGAWAAVVLQRAVE